MRGVDFVSVSIVPKSDLILLSSLKKVCNNLDPKLTWWSGPLEYSYPTIKDEKKCGPISLSRI